jgi:hypothetical protein
LETGEELAFSPAQASGQRFFPRGGHLALSVRKHSKRAEGAC